MEEGAAAIGVGVTAVDLIVVGGGGRDGGGKDGPLSRHATDTARMLSATCAPALLVAAPPAEVFGGDNCGTHQAGFTAAICGQAIVR